MPTAELGRMVVLDAGINPRECTEGIKAPRFIHWHSSTACCRNIWHSRASLSACCVCSCSFLDRAATKQPGLSGDANERWLYTVTQVALL